MGASKADSIVVICPDTNIRLWADRVQEAPIGGGKSAILQMAAAWARAGHRVTLAGASVVEEESAYRVSSLENAAGSYDTAIYITGSLGHFNLPAIERIEARYRVFWINGPHPVSLPPGPAPDVIIAPARFMARRAIEEWGFPADRVVVIPGEATTRGAAGGGMVERDPYAVIYASHPHKGINNIVRLIERVRPDYPALHLDVYGSAVLHGDHFSGGFADDLPSWVRLVGALPQRTIERRMRRYGLMLYLTSYTDGFSLATAEALTAGVIVMASGLGSNAEFIRHGWNGWLVPTDAEDQPDLEMAEALLRRYLAAPSAYEDMRHRAAESVPSWDEQASAWVRVWSRGEKHA